jgi:hypothetical protein
VKEGSALTAAERAAAAADAVLVAAATEDRTADAPAAAAASAGKSGFRSHCGGFGTQQLKEKQ